MCEFGAVLEDQRHGRTGGGVERERRIHADAFHPRHGIREGDLSVRHGEVGLAVHIVPGFALSVLEVETL